VGEGGAEGWFGTFVWCYKYCAQMSFRSEYYRGSTFIAGLKNAVLAGLCAVGNTPIEYCTRVDYSKYSFHGMPNCRYCTNCTCGIFMTQVQLSLT